MATIVKTLGVFLALFVGWASANAEAIKVPPGYYASAWFAEPEAIQANAEPIKKGKLFRKTMIFPHQAYTLNAPITVESGTISLPQGTELIGLMADRTIGCSRKSVKRSAASKILLKAGTTHICFVDADKNGKFEGYFFAENTPLVQKHVASLFTMFRSEGAIPSELSKLAETSYSDLPVKNLSKPEWLFGFYYTASVKSKWYSLAFYTDNDDWFIPQVGGYFTRRYNYQNLPHDTEFLGWTIRVTGFVDGRIQIVDGTPPEKRALFVGTRCCLN